MLRLILALLLLLLLGQAAGFWLAHRERAARVQLYRELRVYIVGADSLETRLRWAEARYSQCMAQF